MAEQVNNSFTSFKLTDQELDAAVVLSPSQVFYFHSLQADTAEMLLGIKFDPNQIFSYAQEEAYLRGQLELIKFLLAQDSSAKLARSREEETLRNQTKQQERLKGVTHENL